MTKKISDMRISYERVPLNREELNDDPLALFSQWFDEAVSAEILEPNAMTLATSTADGIPSARVVLLKGVDHGFKFFTNYDSQKGRELAANPIAALVFHWDILHRSVRIVGDVARLTGAESAEYYHSRPRGSQMGAWTSPQSTMITDRSVLEQRLHEIETRFAETDPIPLPDFWGGYRVVPRTIEFWQGRASRLHDRFRYTKAQSGTWAIERLAP